MEGKLEVWGGTTEHGRACYYVSVGDQSILLDCGINIVTGEMPEIDYDKLTKVDYILLSHAHEDHSKGLIELIKLGYRKKVIMSEETGRQLYELYSSILSNCAHDFKYVDQMADYLEWFKLSEHIELCYGASGHMYGAIWFLIKIDGKVIFYSGDYNHQVQILPFHSPEKAMGSDVIDFAIIDCANGLEEHKSKKEAHEFGKRNLFIVNRFSKAIEVIVGLSEQYPNHSFYYDEALYDEIVRQVKSRKRRLHLCDEQRHRHSESFRLEWFKEADFIFLEQDLLNSERQFAVASFLQNNGHQIYLTSKANFLKYQETFFSDRILYLSVKAHQGVKGVINLLNVLKVKKAILCHLDGDENIKSVKMLQSKGFDNVYFCEVRASIAF
ncbi:MBL fold metallo-hydrolase [Fusibacter ferrireducens]|uniref:MBL fold metallo-hydrolase n=1 Tax=Fusibacter ferrireducens TaxID=2785058 RepID=A0ABR9ZQ26_9FIRM|nr:MBL fold metallo-hydrolase [Fusibacter ferrireducens]MBF4692573.1 MBL fold metallo-hydrolase [Fusibacter ferrireducens]